MGLDDGSMNMGRPGVTYIDNLKSNISIESAKELRTAMLDRETRPPRSKLKKIQGLFKDLHRHLKTFEGFPLKFKNSRTVRTLYPGQLFQGGRGG